MNLARVESMARDGAACPEHLRAALTYCPNLEEMRRLLEQMTSCGGADAK